MHRLSILFFSLLLIISNSVFSQCKNSIALKKAVSKNELTGKGIIEISVSSSEEYQYTLNIEKGSGLQQVTEKKGKGDTIVKFEGLDTDLLYLVDFEFLNEDKKYCRKLQLSQIVIDKE
jgi:hypothetical protein